VAIRFASPGWGQSDALPIGIPSVTFGNAPLLWLNYCHPDGRFDRFAGVVVVESYTHLHASMKAAVSGADRGLGAPFDGVNVVERPFAATAVVFFCAAFQDA
jgi:hypothetical protein